jgi:hypothetical protein
MEKLIDLGKYIEMELINWKITFPDCGELLIALYRGRLIVNEVLSLFLYINALVAVGSYYANAGKSFKRKD